MNEFIVWDKEKKELYTPNQMNFNDKGEHIKTDRFEWCQYIGLKDINDKKIYANCSIVEFNFYNGDWIKDFGFFNFDEENLRYVVHLINEKEIVDYDPSYFDNFEIIDTIQENKLGLIK